ncbi:hypothetical protein [Streptococcus pluranimalium]|uniref:hypothetical protein n=1 Tax=Streptococcus pluranimalium TaxID=82348 RepID=UPI003139E5AF
MGVFVARTIGYLGGWDKSPTSQFILDCQARHSGGLYFTDVISLYSPNERDKPWFPLFPTSNSQEVTV